ncbi:uncharacterized protein EI90DRAFT_214287 [Cantharellus anzutake]|uniref:uncharacterized protein n=1 Tax=Cantharellus anzutake TaxID=1750568 RepID=UPI0019036AC4|nr:uncharacterized protein EI90DRAFT_214287 [Cantharellus anzutake]KAF8317004.1 hypothetical protein EI90DRAFT_214287 [Cantharellus anzutake]
MSPEAIRNKINLENGNLVIVASLTVLIWDWLICLDRERRHFWGSKPNAGTVLYFLNRGVSMLGAILHLQTSMYNFAPHTQLKLCGPLIRTVTSLSALNIAVVQVILTMRTYALYSCNKGGLLNQVLFMWLGPWTVIINSQPAPYTGCLIRLPTWSWERLVPIMTFEILSIVLFAIKFCSYVKMGSMGVVPRMLFRDGFLGFLATSICTSIGLLVQILRPRPLLTFGVALTPLVPTLVAAHMLLNIRDVMKVSSPVAKPTAPTAARRTQPRSSQPPVRGSFPGQQVDDAGLQNLVPDLERKGADSGGKDHYDDEDDEDDDDDDVDVDVDGDGDDGDNRRDRRGYHGFGNADSLRENWYEMKARPSETRYDPKGTASLSLSGRNPAPSEGTHPASPAPVALPASTSVIPGNEAAAGSSVGGPYLPQERTYPLRAGGRRLETTFSQRSEEGDVIDIP